MIRKNAAGFTIMELMIAISVLSVIMLICATVLAGIGSVISKGENVTNVQDAARNTLADISSNIQFSGQPVQSGTWSGYTDVSGNKVSVQAYCVGDVRYSYAIYQSGVSFPDNWPHQLWKDQMMNDTTCSPLDILQSKVTCGDNTACTLSQPGTGLDLVAPNMLVGSFRISPLSPSLYSLSIGLAIGQEDMFSSFPPGVDNYKCNLNDGQQYCATSYLSTFAAESMPQ